MADERTVRNCRDPFKFKCPKKWEALAKTNNEEVRFCDACKENVYFCATDEETIQRARQGQCIARIMPTGSDTQEMYVGKPAGVPVDVSTPERLEQAHSRWKLETPKDPWHRERGIDKALAEIRNARRNCPECSYPVSDFWTDCRVCHYHLGRL